MKTDSMALALTALTVAALPALADVLLPPEIRGGEVDVTEWAASPPGVSTQVLARGREVYSDLLDARTAAVSHHSLGLRLALEDARRQVRELGAPAQVRALKAQLAIIRRDLGNTRTIPDKELWVPVTAEVEQLLVNAPDAVKAKARSAVRQGRAAAAQGNRVAAGKALDTLATEIEYRAGGFPLNTVTEDVRSAWEAARAAEPNWAAIGETLKSALAQMHWVTRIEAHGLLTAYYGAEDAEAILPDSPAQARRYLRQAAEDLSDTPGMAELAGNVLTLTRKRELSVSDVRNAISKLSAQMRLSQHQAAAQYLKNGGSAQP
jgi:hypothetical protein